MKVENKITDLAKSPTEKLRYSDLAIQILNIIRKPMTTIEMRDAIKELELLEQAGEEFELSDSQFELIKSSIPNVKFPFIHKDYLDFEDYINSL